MGLRKLGDSAWIFKSGLADPHRSHALILKLLKMLQQNPISEVTDIVSSFDSIAVHFNPSDGDLVFHYLTSLKLEDVVGEPDVGTRTITVPVVYGGDFGPDLQSLANAKTLTPQELIRLHSEAEYTVAAIGFSPGFPYLLGLPQALRQARHASPRKVPAGSVAIAADQAGIYPFASQGGWHVLGRTNLALFDAQREQASMLKPGDRVRFEAVEHLDFEQVADEPDTETTGRIKVIEPGALTSIQDHGRFGWQHIGVSPSGAADPISASVANRLVGNPDDAAVIECTMTGPKLQIEEDCRLAWVGWANESSGKPIDLKAGARLDLTGRMTHLRGYIAVAGGIDVPLVMGSRSTDIRAKFGGHHGRTLQAGDYLAVGSAPAGPVSGNWHIAWPKANGYLIEVRFIRGMQAEWFTHESREMLANSFYKISPASDRMGTRLTGGKLSTTQNQEMVSQPVVVGSIQVPPDGQPIILMSERQTIGGYPQIGHVISADLPMLARAWPGTQIHFREVTLAEAHEAWFALQSELGMLQAGLNTLT